MVFLVLSIPPPLDSVDFVSGDYNDDLFLEVKIAEIALTARMGKCSSSNDHTHFEHFENFRSRNRTAEAEPTCICSYSIHVRSLSA